MVFEPDLDLLAAEWEGDATIRQRIGTEKALFDSEVAGKALEINTRGAEHHASVLEPLLKRLVDPVTLKVGMCKIPDLEEQLLAFDVFNQCLCFSSGFPFRHPRCFCLIIGAGHVEFNSATRNETLHGPVHVLLHSRAMNWMYTRAIGTTNMLCYVFIIYIASGFKGYVPPINLVAPRPLFYYL